jgi:hypothetical protein
MRGRQRFNSGRRAPPARQVGRRGFLRPFLAFLDGEPTQTADLVAAARILARMMVDQDHQ